MHAAETLVTAALGSPTLRLPDRLDTGGEACLTMPETQHVGFLTPHLRNVANGVAVLLPMATVTRSTFALKTG